jgi:hypothetical protein
LCITCRLFHHLSYKHHGRSLIKTWHHGHPSTAYGVFKSIHARSSTVVTGQVHDIMQGQPRSSMYLHFRPNSGEFTSSLALLWLYHVPTLPAATKRSSTADDTGPNGVFWILKKTAKQSNINWAPSEGQSGKLMLRLLSLLQEYLIGRRL